MMNQLEIINLSKTYPNGVKALDNFSLNLKNGLFGLLGANGAGKSTLIRTIATLQAPDRGSILFNGVDISQNPRVLRAQLGYLPQEFGVYSKLSAYSLLEHLAILKGITDSKIRKEQIDALLVQTNLYQARNKAVSSYSGGMRQRFGIAQALLGNPKLIIVDEPTAGLDPEERNRFHNLLSELGEHLIVLLSTHIVEDVRELCPNMAVMGAGRLLLEGTPDQLINMIRGKIWAKSISKSQIPVYKENHQVLSTRLLAGRIQVHIYSDQQPDTGFELVEPSLEDVYFSTSFEPLTV